MNKVVRFLQMTVFSNIKGKLENDRLTNLENYIAESLYNFSSFVFVFYGKSYTVKLADNVLIACNSKGKALAISSFDKKIWYEN